MGWFKRRESAATVVHVDDPGRESVRENGSFAHGECPDCDWVGPGRRARSAAETDAAEHREKGCRQTT